MGIPLSQARWRIIGRAIFILVGAAQAGYQLSGFTLILSFSTPAERPAYIGVGNTALAPVAVSAAVIVALVSVSSVDARISRVERASTADRLDEPAAMHGRLPQMIGAVSEDQG